MGLPDFWTGSGFEEKLLQAQGDFSLNAGQHSVTYLPNDETTATGRYQVLLYDNNFGAAESYPKFDWGQLGAAVVTDYSRGSHSFGRIFTVDEVARTYGLEDQIAVPFSGYVSSASAIQIVCSWLRARPRPLPSTIAMDCPSPPTRWKPRSTSTACTSTSCSAALGFDQWSMKTRRSPMPPPRVAAI